MRLEESGDKAPSHSVKRANLELICKEYNVILALDDSSQDVDMYRQSGINTWQVADNNF